MIVLQLLIKKHKMSEKIYTTSRVNGLDLGPTSELGGRVEDIDKAYAMAEAMRSHMDFALRAKKAGAIALPKLGESSRNSLGEKVWGDEVALQAKTEKLHRELAVGQGYFAGRRYDSEHPTLGNGARVEGHAVTTPEDDGNISPEMLALIPDDRIELAKFVEEKFARFEPSKIPLWAAYLAKQLKKQASSATGLPKGARYPGSANGVIGNGSDVHYLRHALGAIQRKTLSPEDLSTLPFSEVAKSFGFDVRKVVPNYDQIYSERPGKA